MGIEKRGFATLALSHPERLREIARKGGKISRGGGRPRKQKPEDAEGDAKPKDDL